MPRFTAEQIYASCRHAGFSPDQSATMTAIALAESGGDSRSHATVGEDSRGLWQINAAAHPDLAQRFDLYDPTQNAQAAFIVSHGGQDVSPWTVTHGGLGARYLRFKDEAQAAAAAYGDGPNHGVWTGTAGYGHPMSAGRGGPGTADPHTTEGSDSVVVHNAAAATPAPGGDYGIPLEDKGGTDYGIPLEGLDAVAAPAAAAAAAPAGSDHLHTFLTAATTQRGDQYIFGVMDRLDDPNPKAFDCSMLVQWSAHQAGVDMPRNAWDQYTYLHERGMVVPVDQAIHTPGALLFSFNSDPNTGRPVQQHVAISLGDGKTIEARGSQYGVDSFDATPRRFQYAAVIPGISDHVTPGSAAPVVPTTDAHGGVVVAPLVSLDPAPPPAAPTNDFSDRLAHDPDHLDTTPAPPPPPPPPVDPHAVPAQHDPLYFTITDADHDGLDDSLAQAGAHGPDDFDQHHDHGPGHA
jgi:cell wall-associated NlpC family hydrolase